MLQVRLKMVVKLSATIARLGVALSVDRNVSHNRRIWKSHARCDTSHDMLISMKRQVHQRPLLWKTFLFQCSHFYGIASPSLQDCLLEKLPRVFVMPFRQLDGQRLNTCAPGTHYRSMSPFGHQWSSPPRVPIAQTVRLVG